MTNSLPKMEVLPRDLAPYRQGNVGVDYVHSFDSGQPGPHVLVNGLTHGNEFCGMRAVTHLLDAGVRPLVGTLTLSLANVGAYETFDASRPFESRQLVHDFNRIWSSEWLDGPQDSPELRRARQMRSVVAAADHVLDLHSTSDDVVPFWVYPKFERNSAVALAIGRPSVHFVMPGGLTSGAPLMQYAHHGLSTSTGVAVVVECGQHFLEATSEVAMTVARDFLAHFGMVPGAQKNQGARMPPQRFELLQTCVIKTDAFRLVRPLAGFEVFAKDELIAIDGDEEIRAPCEACTVLMPARVPRVGREGVYLARSMN